IRPIIWSVLLYFLGFFVLDLVTIEYLIYGAFGFGLFLSSGLLFGLMLLMMRMRSDILDVMQYSLKILKQAVADVNLVSQRTKPAERIAVNSLLFTGIMHMITIPIVAKIIGDRIPIIGGLVQILVKKILRIITGKVTLDTTVAISTNASGDVVEDELTEYSESLSSSANVLDKIVSTTFKVIRFPFLIGFLIFFFVLIGFLYLLN
ncbi:MAG: hypothetical protein AAF985_27830, partial [Bacteroidota bacterium]